MHPNYRQDDDPRHDAEYLAWTRGVGTSGTRTDAAARVDAHRQKMANAFRDAPAGGDLASLLGGR